MAGSAVALWGPRDASPVLGPRRRRVRAGRGRPPAHRCASAPRVRTGVAGDVTVVDGELIAYAVALSVGQFATSLPSTPTSGKNTSTISDPRSWRRGSAPSRWRACSARWNCGRSPRPSPARSAPCSECSRQRSSCPLGRAGLPERLAAVPEATRLRAALGTSRETPAAAWSARLCSVSWRPSWTPWRWSSSTSRWPRVGACCPSPDDVPDLEFLIGLAPPLLLASWRGSRTRARRERPFLRDRCLLPAVIHPVVAGSAANLSVTPPDRRWVGPSRPAPPARHRARTSSGDVPRAARSQGVGSPPSEHGARRRPGPTWASAESDERLSGTLREIRLPGA